MEDISPTHIFRYSWMLNALQDVAQNNTVKGRRLLILLGDYVDKGSDSKEVLDYLTYLYQDNLISELF